MNSGGTKIEHTEKPFTALLGHNNIRAFSDLQIPPLGPWRGTACFGALELAGARRAGLQLGTSGCGATPAHAGCCPMCGEDGGAGDAAEPGRAEQDPHALLYEIPGQMRPLGMHTLPQLLGRAAPSRFWGAAWVSSHFQGENLLLPPSFHGCCMHGPARAEPRALPRSFPWSLQ